MTPSQKIKLVSLANTKLEIETEIETKICEKLVYLFTSTIDVFKVIAGFLSIYSTILFRQAKTKLQKRNVAKISIASHQV